MSESTAVAHSPPLLSTCRPCPLLQMGEGRRAVGGAKWLPKTETAHNPCLVSTVNWRGKAEPYSLRGIQACAAIDSCDHEKLTEECRMPLSVSMVTVLHGHIDMTMQVHVVHVVTR